STFCDDFTIVATRCASWSYIVPAPRTAAVVSMLPPNHAPATSGARPSALAIIGITTIIGSAVTITSAVIYVISSFLACTDPAAAIAADTPQIDTAEAITARSVSGNFTRPPNHQVKENTDTTIISACTRPPTP